MTGSDGDATTLESFPGGLRAVVFGASGGLGGAFAALLAAQLLMLDTTVPSLLKRASSSKN